jgi:hypothetical protein
MIPRSSRRDNDYISVMLKYMLAPIFTAN